MTSSNEPDGRGDTPQPGSDPSRALAARLLLMVPLVIGTVLAEAIFAARGPVASEIAMAAAVAGFLLCWQGVAWALHSWVAVLLTFVPAVMITLGAAMVGDVEPVGGAVLLVVGGTLLLAVIWFRVAAPARRWTPGWSATASGTASFDRAEFDGAGFDGAGFDGAGLDRAGFDRAGFDGTGSDGAGFDRPAARPSESGASRAPSGRPRALHGSGAGRRPATRSGAPATDTAARDAFVVTLCQRGGAAGPTVATLEEFFTGNGDPGSIAASLHGLVPLSTFASVLHLLRARPDVAEVLVQIEPLAEGSYPAGTWPAAGSIRVVGAVQPDDLDAAVAALRPASALGPLPVTELADGRAAPADAAEYALWWE